MYIYTVTGIEALDEQYGTKGSIRCFGYYSKFDTADIRVKQNSMDIYECLYNYMVIEKVEEGLYPIALERWFYKYDESINQFAPIEEPKYLTNVVNFGIG